MSRQILTFSATLLLLISLLFIDQQVCAQGSTSSSMSGTIVDTDGNPVAIATVVATHTPTGKQYGTVTRDDGRFNLSNMRVGGPYTVNIQFVGYENILREGVYLSLGKDRIINETMRAAGVTLDEVVVQAGGLMGSERTGAETTIGSDVIEALPTINRNLEDFVRLTPQASTSGDGISFANTNNRYNAIFIDGAINNDVFGLSADGTNGGQTGISPISPDAIDELQVVLAPYDVTIGGFTGGGINAVTRSGSNDVEGSVYWLHKNQDLVGKTPTFFEISDDDREKVDDFSANTFGIRVGGPIVKNKAFFFVNAEIQRDETPNPFDANNYEGNSSIADLERLKSRLNEYGYDPGSYGDVTDRLEGEKFLARLDFNLNDKHTLTARHSYTKGTNTNVFGSSATTINFENNGILFPSTTNSSAIELSSIIGSDMSNSLIVGYTTVKDDRDALGSNFPNVRIEDGDGTIRFGSEAFSTGNALDQKIFTLTDNFKLFKGKNTITIGTHNEFYNMYNLFIRQNYGAYEFDSVDDFINGENAVEFNRSYSLVDDVTGDGSKAAAEFKAAQLGFYIQDEFEVNRRIKITGGLRLDIPFFLDDPVVDDNFNTNTIPLIESAGYDMKGARAGQMPKTQFLLSPRLGFNIAANDSRKTVIRGGLGIFTGRVPFVWPGGTFTNNGLSVGSVFQQDVPFIADWDNQPTVTDFGGADVIPSGQIDLFAEDFKYPQVFRTSLAVDQELPGGVIATVEGMYTQNLNSIYYENVNLKNPTETDKMTGTGDDRYIYDRGDEIDETYGRILLASNASDNDADEGHGYNITAQLQKTFGNGLNLGVAYTYGDSYVIYEGTSSQNSSQWRGAHSVNGRNKLTEAQRSDFAMGNKINAFASVKTNFPDAAGGISATFSLFYNGQDGAPYSHIYNDRGNLTGEDSRERSLVYVPLNSSDIVLVDTESSSAADQWADLDAFISQDDYLNGRRGQYAEKNASRTPWENTLDVQGKLGFFIKTGEKRHRMEATLDVFNFLNLINKDWGRDFFMSDGGNFGSYELLNFEGFAEDGTTPNYTYTGPTNSDTIYGFSDFTSRWRAQVGLRYIFN